MQPDLEIWLDTNLSPIIAKWMGDYLNVTVRSSYTLNFHHLDDLTIYQRAKGHGNVILISKDADFHKLINRLLLSQVFFVAIKTPKKLIIKLI